MVSIRRIIFPGLLPSFIKIRYYRWFKGAKIGKGSKISIFSYVKSPNISIGINCKIGIMTFIETVKEVKLGNRVKINMQTSIRTGILHIGDDTEIMDNVRIGGILTHKSSLLIGKQVGIFPYSYINPSYEIIIEDGVGIGGRSHLFTHGGWHSALDGYPIKYAPIIIKTKAWLAWRVTVVPGITIGEGSIVQADSLVTKDIPPFHYARGNPILISKFKIFDHNNEKKISIIKETWENFFEYQKFIGKKIELFEENELQISYKMQFKKNKETFLVFWYDDHTEKYIDWRKNNQFDKEKIIVMFLDKKIFNELSDEFKTKKYSYFIIEDLKIYGRNEINGELQEFFKRYWINFEFKNHP
ncbi:MAG: putative acetyltransferase [Candidatus Heimdallarchaeota archaeon LC_3]|nr:MAG: putative acetyltransferase [Candidatus Heimdallarchaeota archaeon LC_3]